MKHGEVWGPFGGGGHNDEFFFSCACGWRRDTRIGTADLAYARREAEAHSNADDPWPFALLVGADDSSREWFQKHAHRGSIRGVFRRLVLAWDDELCETLLAWVERYLITAPDELCERELGRIARLINVKLRSGGDTSGVDASDLRAYDE